MAVAAGRLCCDHRRLTAGIDRSYQFEESRTMAGAPITSVSFDGPAPGLSTIAEKVAELSGLEVSVEEADSEFMAGHYDVYGDLWFKCDPEDHLNIEVWANASTAESNEHMKTEVIVNYGRDRVRTLLSVAILALESLGGRADPPCYKGERRRFVTPISSSELLRQRRKAPHWSRLQGVILILLLPVLIPLGVVILLCIMLSLPWLYWKETRRLREFSQSDLWRAILAEHERRIRAAENKNSDLNSSSEDQHP